MKALVITIPILLVGAALGAAFTGHLPFFGGGDKPVIGEVRKSADAGDAGIAAETEPAVPEIASPTPEPQEDPVDEVEAVVDEIDADQGARMLAKIWNEINYRELAGIIVVWQDEDLALILSHMEKRTVAEVLSLLGPERAVQLSEEIKALASVVPEEETE